MFFCVCRASQSGNAGKVTWGYWEIRFESHLQLPVNSLIGNSICAIKAGAYSWFLCSSLDFSHAPRKAEMLLKSMLHTAAWEAFPAVCSFCWCWLIWLAQEFLSSELISSNTTPVCKYHFHVYSCVHCFSQGFYFKFPTQESSPPAQENNIAASMTTPIFSKKKITRTLTRLWVLGSSWLVQKQRRNDWNGFKWKWILQQRCLFSHAKTPGHTDSSTCTSPSLVLPSLAQLLADPSRGFTVLTLFLCQLLTRIWCYRLLRALFLTIISFKGNVGLGTIWEVWWFLRNTLYHSYRKKHKLRSNLPKLICTISQICKFFASDLRIYIPTYRYTKYTIVWIPVLNITTKCIVSGCISILCPKHSQSKTIKLVKQLLLYANENLSLIKGMHMCINICI